MKRIKAWWNQLLEWLSEFNAADPFTYSASIAFYTLFSLPAVLFLVVNLAGYVYGEQAAAGQVFTQIDGLLSEEAAIYLQELLAKVNLEPEKNWGFILSVSTLLVGSTTVFVSIQNGLNQIWRVKPDASSGIVKLLLDRLFSFTLVIALGFLLIVSLVVDALMLFLQDYLQQSFPDFSVGIAQTLSFVLGLVVVSVLFATIFRVLPDVKISWKQSLVGGFITALLFSFGKYGIGIYLKSSDLATSYGTAGTLVLLLVWIYYTSVIVLLGGKITEIYVRHQDGKIQPSSHAVQFRLEEIELNKRHEKD